MQVNTVILLQQEATFKAMVETYAMAEHSTATVLALLRCPPVSSHGSRQVV
jgi:hypothetical protein